MKHILQVCFITDKSNSTHDFGYVVLTKDSIYFVIFYLLFFFLHCTFWNYSI